MIKILWSQRCPWRQCQIWRQDWGAPTETGKALLGDPGWSWGRRYHRFLCLHSKQVDHQWWWSILRRGWKFVAANLSISMCHPRLSGGSSIWVWQTPTLCQLRQSYLMMIMTMSVIWFALFTYCDAMVNIQSFHFGENQVMVNVYPSLNNLASIQWVNQWRWQGTQFVCPWLMSTWLMDTFSLNNFFPWRIKLPTTQLLIASHNVRTEFRPVLERWWRWFTLQCIRVTNV